MQYVDITSLATLDPTRANDNILFQGARCLGSTFGGGFWEHAEPLAFIDNSATLTQVLAYRSEATQEVSTFIFFTSWSNDFELLRH
jgi:hypothetical protein